MTAMVTHDISTHSALDNLLTISPNQKKGHKIKARLGFMGRWTHGERFYIVSGPVAEIVQKTDLEIKVHCSLIPRHDVVGSKQISCCIVKTGFFLQYCKAL